MVYRHYRMMEDHSRSAVAHDLSDAFPHFRLITVDFAVGAEGLCLHKGTFIYPLAGILFQFPALLTGCLLMMISFAVEIDHQAYNFFFFFSLILNCFHLQAYLSSSHILLRYLSRSAVAAVSVFPYLPDHHDQKPDHHAFTHQAVNKAKPEGTDRHQNTQTFQ